MSVDSDPELETEETLRYPREPREPGVRGTDETRKISHVKMRVGVLDEPFAPPGVPTEAEPARASLESVDGIATGDTIAGRYRLESRLATSRMSVLYRAIRLELDTVVVVKILRAVEDPAAVVRFRREARLLARLRSPHVVRILDVGVHHGAPFLVMELVEGTDLARLMKQVGVLPTTPAVDLALQVCAALAAAHSHGIVHRDLKPANVCLSARSSGGLHVTVVDFGIAKIFSNDASQAGVTQEALLLGSPRYMAPEQIDGGLNVDPRADVWALGVMLYEVLTGVPPFGAGGGVTETLLAVATKAHRPILELCPDLPPPVARAVEWALEKERDARPSTVRAFAELIAPFGGPEATQRMKEIIESSGQRVRSGEYALDLRAIETPRAVRVVTAPAPPRVQMKTLPLEIAVARDPRLFPTVRVTRRSGRGPWVALGAVLLLALGVATWTVLRSKARAPAVPVVLEPPPVATTTSLPDLAVSVPTAPASTAAPPRPSAAPARPRRQTDPLPTNPY